MPHDRPVFTFQKQLLHAEGIPVPQIAMKFGTPVYVYSATAIERRLRLFDSAFGAIPHTICYSVKANSNLALLKLIARAGAGFDVVSGGELERVRRAAPKSLRKVVFSGVGKMADELDAALRAKILIFNIESEAELELLAHRARAVKRVAPIALRVNPDVAANTHPYISTGLRQHKFGIAIEHAQSLYALAAKQKSLVVTGVSVHIGSQIVDVAPFGAALSRVADLVRILRTDGHKIRYVDCGGGLGIDYQHGETEAAFGQRVHRYAQELSGALSGLRVHLLLEPGRAIVAPAGILLTRVLYLKENGGKRFVITDAAMNDLLRPALYSAHHEIVPVRWAEGANQIVDVVGPVCESGDFFARDRELPKVEAGDLLAILDTGAYGMSLASNYNSRPRPAEVLVKRKRLTLIRRRETVEDLLRNEQ